MKHLLGTKNAVLEDDDAATRPEKSNGVKLMGQVNSTFSSTSDFRMASTGLYSDIVFLQLHLHERRLVSTDMHPYVHVFQAAVDCAWETKSDWDTFRTLAETVSRVAKSLALQNTKIS